MAIPTTLRLEFVTPERAIVHDEVDELQLPGEEGFLGVLPGHTPMLVSLKVGEMWYRKGTEKFHGFVGFGFAEILPDRVTILARIAEKADDIDLERAQSAKRRAEERLAEVVKGGVSEMDYERARIALLRAITRLQVSQHARTRG
ncbi:MAG: F0F1 ATP synthase subunit epsilon [Acidobacteria bacterium]|jgi:F-type H+-transporting ATPase subunit epsilon|nr:F0F1 ATP synthase subunit epsilon [Acidobacteriota bacterium]